MNESASETLGLFVSAVFDGAPLTVNEPLGATEMAVVVGGPALYLLAPQLYKINGAHFEPDVDEDTLRSALIKATNTP